MSALKPRVTSRQLKADKLRLLAQQYRDDFKAFARAAWPLVVKRKLVWGWYLDAICDHLQAVFEGRLAKKNLLLCVAPRHGKSTLLCVLFPAWCWARNPEYTMIFGSYAMRLAQRDSRSTKRLVKSQWYQELFGPLEVEEGEDRVDDWANSKGGRRMCVAVDSAGTGFGADLIVIDDAHAAKESHSDAEREKAVTWYRETISTRLDDELTGRMVVSGQRIHDSDVCGYVLREEADDFTALILAEEFDPAKRCVTYVANDNGEPVELWHDPREKPGDLLFEERFPREILAKRRKKLGSGYFAQYLQDPVDPSTAIFKRAAWRFYRLPGGPAVAPGRPQGCYEGPAVDLPTDIERRVIGVDCAFDGQKQNDFVAMQDWGKRRADKFLLNRRLAQLTFNATVDELKSFHRVVTEDAKARGDVVDIKTVVELAANGHAVVNTLSSEIPGLEGITAKGSKVARATAASRQQGNGNLFLPDGAPWLEEFIGQHDRFPKGRNDDEVDAMAHAVNELTIGEGDESTSLERTRRLLGMAV